MRAIVALEAVLCDVLAGREEMRRTIANQQATILLKDADFENRVAASARKRTEDDRHLASEVEV